MELSLRLLIGFFIALLGSSPCAWAVDDGVLSLAFDSTVGNTSQRAHLGKVLPGTESELLVRLLNSGSSPIALGKVESLCSCTGTKISATNIDAGAVGEFSSRISWGKRIGPKATQLTFNWQANGTAYRSRLIVEVNICDVAAFPSGNILDLTSVTDGGRGEVLFTLGEYPVKWNRVVVLPLSSNESDWMTCGIVTPNAPGEPYRFTATKSPSLAAGTMTAVKVLRFYCDDVDTGREVNVKIISRNNQFLEVSPPEVFIHTDNKDGIEKRSASVFVSSRIAGKAISTSDIVVPFSDPAGLVDVASCANVNGGIEVRLIAHLVDPPSKRATSGFLTGEIVTPAGRVKTHLRYFIPSP